MRVCVFVLWCMFVYDFVGACVFSCVSVCS